MPKHDKNEPPMIQSLTDMVLLNEIRGGDGLFGSLPGARIRVQLKDGKLIYGNVSGRQFYKDFAMADKQYIAWGAAVSPEFLARVMKIQTVLGLDASNLMSCMKFESNLNSKARNPMSSATGLIQFMDSTAKELGTTTAALYAMTPVEQLDYVASYFGRFAVHGKNLKDWNLYDTYMAILWPAAIGKPDDYKLFIQGTTSFRVNVGLDINHDGTITKKEACHRVQDLHDFGLTPGNFRIIQA